jgi:gas vesicle protein
MFQKKTKILLGGLLLGSLVGTLSAIFQPTRRKLMSQLSSQSKGWADKVRHASQTALHDINGWKNPPHEAGYQKFLSGALLGVLAGIGSALLFSPKSGKQFRNELPKKYHDFADKTQEIVHFINHDNQPQVLNHAKPMQTKKRSSVKTPRLSPKTKLKPKE